jgi:hypothetical protein
MAWRLVSEALAPAHRGRAARKAPWLLQPGCRTRFGSLLMHFQHGAKAGRKQGSKVLANAIQMLIGS